MGTANGEAGRSVVVDPRMRRRRIAVRRDAGRRRLRRAVGVLAVIALVLGAYLVTQSPLLDVDHIQVEGAHRTAEDEVRSALGITRGDPMIEANTGGAARRAEELPWVLTAEVRREWPGTLVVKVTERTPVASVSVLDEQIALLDTDGRVLSVGDEVPEGLVVLSGVRGRVGAGETVSDDAQDALAVVTATSERLPGAITEVSTKLDAELTSGGIARFGSIEKLDEKVVALEAMLANVDVACLDVVDLRVPRSPAVTRGDTCP